MELMIPDDVDGQCKVIDQSGPYSMHTLKILGAMWFRTSPMSAMVAITKHGVYV